METETRPAVELTDSLLIEGHVIIARRERGKTYAATIFTREELQAIVQQAHDVYGVTADPFASPGSADADPWPDHVGYGAHDAHCPDPCRHDAECPHGKANVAGETCLVCIPAGSGA